MQIQVKNKSTGQIENIEDSQLQSAVTSGNYLVPDQQYDVSDSYGNISKKSSTDLVSAFQNGYVAADDNLRHENNMRQKYGDQTIKALLYGGARGLTFGLSDQALSRTGIVSQEELKQVQERNKGMSVAGEIGGALLPLLLSGGSSSVATGAELAAEAGGELGGKTLVQKILSYAPSKIVSEVGSGATNATKGIIEALIGVDDAKVAGAGLDVVDAANAAKSISSTKKIADVLSAITTHGVGAAAEGSMYGIGNLISEEALGDKEFNAESVASSLLQGAKIGGLIGGTIGGVSSLLDGAGQKAFLKAKKALLDSPELSVEKRAALKNLDEGAQLIEAGRDSIDKARAIKEASERTGQKTTPGMLSSSREFKDLERHIGTSSYGVGMPSVSREIDAAYKSAEDVSYELLNKPSKSLTNSEIGGTIQKSVVARIDDALEHSSKMYNQWDEVSSMVKVSPEEIQDITDQMEKHFLAKKVGGERVTREIEQVKNITNLDELNMVRSQFGKDASAKYLTDPTLADFYAETRKMFDVARENAVMRASPDLKKIGINADEFLNMKDLADKNHEQIYKDNGFIESLFGIGKPKTRQILSSNGESIGEESLGETAESAQKQYEIEKKVSKNIRAFKQKILEMNPDKLSERILKGSTEDIKLFQKNFPEAFEVVKANKLSDLWQQAKNVEGKISTKQLLKRLEKETPEMRSALGIDESKFKDIKLVTEQLPSDFNPTGSGKVASIADIFSPIKQTKEAGLFSIYKLGDRALQKQLLEIAPTMKAIESTGNSFHDSISSGSKKFFQKLVDNSKGDGVKISIPKQMTKEELDKVKEAYTTIQTDPNKFTEDLIKKNQKMSEHAPGISAITGKKLFGITSYLLASIPKRNNTYFNDNHEPSKSDLMAFSEKYKAATDPKSVFKQLESGYASSRSLETIKAVYPSAFQKFVGGVMGNIPKNLNNRQRMALSRTLGISTMPSSSPAALSILQGNAQKMKVDGDKQKTRKIDLSKISVNNETSLSKTFNR